VLADYPDAGRVVPEFGQPFLHELIRPPFRIAYRRDREAVRVVRVWGSERLPRLPIVRRPPRPPSWNCFDPVTARGWCQSAAGWTGANIPGWGVGHESECVGPGHRGAAVACRSTGGGRRAGLAFWPAFPASHLRHHALWRLPRHRQRDRGPDRAGRSSLAPAPRTRSGGHPGHPGEPDTSQCADGALATGADGTASRRMTNAGSTLKSGRLRKILAELGCGYFRPFSI